MKNISPFHLAIPVHNLEDCRLFYTELLGCEQGRSSEQWVDLNFFDHQVVIHYKPKEKKETMHTNPVDGKNVPVPHFGVVLPWDDFFSLAEKFRKNAIDFVKGTDQQTFLELNYSEHIELPNFYGEGVYLYEMDGVELKIALSSKMILTKHENSPGVLLILLSALASKNINIIDLRLGKRNKIGYSALAIDGDSNIINDLLTKLGEQYYEANLIEFHSI